MKKVSMKPGTLLAPVPVCMVSCGRAGEKPNIITIAWTGIINSDPPMTYISVRKERYSHKIISETREFIINLTTDSIAFATDWCGVKSGRDEDKFKAMNLTAVPGMKVGCPLIEESPVCLECHVTQVIELGSHDMFISEIVNIQVDSNLLDHNGKLHMEKAGLIAYNHGHYYPISNREIGRFGYSVMKPKTRKRYETEKKAASRQRSRAKARKNVF